MTRRALLGMVLALPMAAGCVHVRVNHAGRAATAASAPPAWLLGEFVDDYDSRYTISAAEWRQGVHGRLHIIRWSVEGQYLIARNDSANQSDPGKFTRVDWMPLAGMAPYTWAYCYSAYKAETAAEAEAVTIANRAAPRTGCSGFPFSRMKQP